MSDQLHTCFVHVSFLLDPETIIWLRYISNFVPLNARSKQICSVWILLYTLCVARSDDFKYVNTSICFLTRSLRINVLSYGVQHRGSRKVNVSIEIRIFLWQWNKGWVACFAS